MEKKIPVAFISDDNFIMPTCVAITSLIMNKKPDTVYDIIIIMEISVLTTCVTFL